MKKLHLSAQCIFAILLFLTLSTTTYAQIGLLDTAYCYRMGLNLDSYGGVVLPDSSIIVIGAFTTSTERFINRIVKLHPDGSNDYTFNPGTGPNNYVSSIVRQTDGKLLITGSFNTYNGASAGGIARIDSTGAIDNTYRSNSGNGFNGTPMDMKLQSDGKLVVVGSFTGYKNLAGGRIVRIKTDGNRDSTFAMGSGANAVIRAIGVQSDGKYIIVGDFTTYNGVGAIKMARLNTDGSLDTSFHVPGTGSNGIISDVAVTPGDRIIIGGTFTSYNGTAANYIIGITSNGAIDTSFHYGTGFNSYVEALKLQPDGKIIVVGELYAYNGYTFNGGGFYQQGLIVRIDTLGNRDTGFDPGIGLKGTGAYGLFLNNDNKIFVCGSITMAGSYSRPYLAKLNTNGSVDQSFYYHQKINGTALAMGVQSDGKVILAGSFSYYDTIPVNNIVRLTLSGDLDTSFHIGAGANAAIRNLAVLSNDKILIVGDFTSYSGTTTKPIARLNSDGSFDSGFSVGSTSIGTNVKCLAVDTLTGKFYAGGQYNIGSAYGIGRFSASGTYDAGFNVGAGFNAFVGSDNIRIQKDRKVLVAGPFTTYKGVTQNYLVRLDTLGNVDTSFHTGSGPNNEVIAVDVQADGKIIIGGTFTSYNGTTRNHIARLNANGSIDSSFASTISSNAIVCVMALKEGVVAGIINGGSQYLNWVDTTGNANTGLFGGVSYPDNAIASLCMDNVNQRIFVGSYGFKNTAGYPVPGYAFLKYNYLDGATAVSPLCASATSKVYFTNKIAFNSGNTFTAQLSDSAGNFTSPTSIGTVSNYNKGADSISITIPGGALTSSHYKIRVTSSSPIYIGTATPFIRIGPNSVTITPGGATTFCSGGSVILTAGNNTSYTWSNSATTQAITATTSGTYTVTVSSNNCSATASQNVTVNSNPSAPTITAAETSGTTNNDGVICNGSSLTLHSSTATHYHWSSGDTVQTTASLSPTTNTTYTVTITDGNGCSTTNNYTVTVNANPSAPTITSTETSGNTNNDGIICNGANVSLQTSSASSYLWSTSATTQSIGGLTPTSNATYTVTITDGNGCRNNNSYTVTVTALPTAPTAPTPQTSCNDGSHNFVFSSVYSGSGGNKIEWAINSSFSGSHILLSPATISYSFSGNTAKTFWIRDIDTVSGCLSTAVTTTARIFPAVHFSLSDNSDSIYVSQGNVGIIRALVTAGVNPFTYSWSNGGTTRNISGLATGTYTVTVSDSNSCSATASRTITAKPGCGIDSISLSCSKCVSTGTEVEHFWNVHFSYGLSDASQLIISSKHCNSIEQSSRTVKYGSNDILLVATNSSTTPFNYDTITVSVIDKIFGDTCTQILTPSLICSFTDHLQSCGTQNLFFIKCTHLSPRH